MLVETLLTPFIMKICDCVLVESFSRCGCGRYVICTLEDFAG